MNQTIAKLLATFFYIGKAPIAPGTFGSMPAFPICYIILYFVQNNKVLFSFGSLQDVEQLFMSFLTLSLVVSGILFFVGTFATKKYIEGKEDQDPSEVVIDEVVGQMIVISLTSISIFFINASGIPSHFPALYVNIFFLIILPFTLFRLFDALKPWPISWFDKNVKGALGVMLDDVVAAIFATTAHFVVVFVLIDIYY